MSLHNEMAYVALDVQEDELGADEITKFGDIDRRKNAILDEINEQIKKEKTSRNTILREIDAALQQRANVRLRPNAHQGAGKVTTEAKIKLEAAAMARKNIDELKKAKDRAERDARLSTDELIKRQYKGGSYRTILAASLRRIKAAEAKAKDEKEQLEAERDEKEIAAEEMSLKLFREDRASYVTRIAEYKIQHHPDEGSYFTFSDASYNSWMNHNYLGLITGAGHSYFLFDLFRIFLITFELHMLKIKDPSMEQINIISGSMMSLLMIACFLNFDPKSEATSKVKEALNDPSDTLWGLMKKNPILSICMLKNFFDSAYSQVIQLADKVGYGIYPLLAFASYSVVVAYSVPFLASKLFKASEEWRRHPWLPVEITKSLYRLDFNNAAANIYIGLLQLAGDANYCVTYGWFGYKQVTQLPDLIPMDPPSQTAAYVSGAISCVTSMPIAYKTRALAVRDHFHFAGPQSDLVEATRIYDSRSRSEKNWQRFQRVCFSPLTGVNAFLLYTSADYFSLASRGENVGTNLGAGIGITATAAFLQYCYHQADRYREIATIARNIKDAGVDQANALAHFTASLFAGVTQLSLFTGGTVGGIILLIGNDYLKAADIEAIRNTPMPSMQMMLLALALQSFVNVAQFYFMKQAILEATVAKSPGLFRKKALNAPQTQVQDEKAGAVKGREKESKQGEVKASNGFGLDADRDDDQEEKTSVKVSTVQAGYQTAVYDAEDDESEQQASSWWNCFRRGRG